MRSTTYTIDVSNLPYVKQMDLQYRYPAYTQLTPLDVDSTGDIAALKGTIVRVRVAPTVPTTGGRVIVDGGDTLKLVPTDDGQLDGDAARRQARLLQSRAAGPGRAKWSPVRSTTRSTCCPTARRRCSSRSPAATQKVLSVDEVYTEARAEDDYGVAKLELVYSVNGAPEQTMSLHDGTRAIRDISAGYTFMLEGLKLEPGDVVSYYARATDNNAVSGAQRRVDRHLLPAGSPVRKRLPPATGWRRWRWWRRRQQPDDAGQLSQKQRDIIAATFKTARDSAHDRQEDARREPGDDSSVAAAAARADEPARDRLVERGIASSDSNWKKIARDPAEGRGRRWTRPRRSSAQGSPRSALQPEQRALQQLQRAEAVFREIQVSMGGGGGGGGGGGQKTDAKDLADIFELQKDKLRNQYETVQRGQQQSQQQQQADNQVDETVEKLRQLAARQQQENDRARRKADSLSQMGQSGASGGQGQRDMAQQTEEQARQLERLAREQQSQRSPTRRVGFRTRRTRCDAPPRTEARRAGTRRRR